VALSILPPIGVGTLRSRYLWQGRRTVEPGRQPVWATDYLAGLVFIAGATAAAHDPGQSSASAGDACALLWLLACLCALARHLPPRAARTNGEL
jgi:hypothetical protein